ncbi:MAG TPA: indole-3-glycerol phosphate synthase TrpC [Solirubrobacteraceae bacterium]|nr:indole-3-glycerol phosphate synthase TrpC [Solirubrobacteraceae bacterium]
MNALEGIVAQTREELERRRRRTPVAQLEARAAQRSDERRPFAAALARPGLSVIAEHKRRSPSAGAIREGIALEEVVGAYERGGAAALSILTEGPSFGGSLADLQSARDASALPLLRKDFVVDPYQVTEALAAGADAILLIVAALTDRELSALHDRSRAVDLAALVEVHDAAELERALAIGAEIIGINNRDLTTLAVDTGRTFELLPGVPAGATVVAESGFRTRAELDELERSGVDAVLVGEALMRSPEIETACRELAGGRPLADQPPPPGGRAPSGSVSPL